MVAAEIAPPEKRRAPRIPAELLVKIEGFHSDYHRVRGNISGTGLLLELASAPGRPGDLEILHLCTIDRERRVTVMGQIVRCVTVDSLDTRDPTLAVAFRFMRERGEIRLALEDLIEQLVEDHRLSEALSVDHRFGVEVHPPKETPKAATVFRIHVNRMLLETTWPVNLGDRVRLVFRTGKTRLPFEGLVEGVEPRSSAKEMLYKVEVGMRPLGERVSPSGPNAQSVSDSIDLVLSELMVQEASSPEPAQRHLSGRLERIPLTSLLTFLEMERQSGRVALEDDAHTTLFVDQGQIIDVAPRTEDPRAQLETALGIQEGRFAFTCETLQRPDRIKSSTTHLLLDWARRTDEDCR